MTEQGVVLNTKDNFAQVRIERNSACGQCGKCGMAESQKHVDFYVENSVNAVSGDVVELDIPEANNAVLAFVAYIIPLIPALLLLMVSLLCGWHDGISVLMFFVGLALGFAVVALIDKKRKHKWAKSPQIKAIIVHAAKVNDVNDN